MKFLLIFLLALPLATFAQSKRDYNRTMEQFVRFYNNNDVNGVCLLFYERPGRECFWKWAQRDHSTLDKYGRILSYEYMGKVPSDPNDIRAYKVLFEKQGVKAMSFHLGSDRLFRTFRLDTMDEEIEQMLAKANRSW
jgi:hypothetical protein